MLIQIEEPSNNTPKPIEQQYAIGIDLGTTNSLVAVMRNGGVDILGSMPSMVEFEPGKPIYSIKRLMGIGREKAMSLGNQYPYNFIDNDNQMVQLDIAGRPVSPLEISAEILECLKIEAEKQLKQPVTKAVITVPAYFDDAARQATKDAAQIAGLEVLRLIAEPTSSALAYGLDNNTEGLYAVYDLGGGTFDISILKMQKGVFQVIATGGDAYLGGDDFDKAIADAYNISHNDAKLRKEQGNYDGDIVNALVKRTINIFAKTLADADLDSDDLLGVVMVGGSTRLKEVQQQISDFAECEILNNLNPDEIVACGAALQADALVNGSDNLLLDVTPLSLGIETYGGLMDVIIPRNTTIPVAKASKFTTYQDNQTGMNIHVLQGERELVENCRSLARFELKGIPPMKAGMAEIEVTLKLDADGLLTVSARETATNTEQTVQIKPTYGLPVERIEQMLRTSMENAQQDIMDRLLRESKISAQQLVDSIERALEEDANLLDAEYLQKLQGGLKLAKHAIAGDNRDKIDAAVQHLDHLSQDFATARVNKGLSDYIAGSKVDEFA